MFPDKLPPTRYHLMLQPLVRNFSTLFLQTMFTISLFFVFIMMFARHMALCLLSSSFPQDQIDAMYYELDPWVLRIGLLSLTSSLVFWRQAVEVKCGYYIFRGGCIPFDKTPPKSPLDEL